MKILLVNENPVVTKLVTLSAQKTSDELDVVSSLEEIETQEYDLLAIDDGVYTQEIFAQIKEAISYKSSLYICSKETLEEEVFDATLKKPFLPTDLVDIFATMGKKSQEVLLDDLDDEIELPEENEDEISLDEEDFDELDELDLDDIELDSLEDELLLDDEESEGEPVLDNEEAQKVKDLLDETSEDGIDMS